MVIGIETSVACMSYTGVLTVKLKRGGRARPLGNLQSGSRSSSKTVCASISKGFARSSGAYASIFPQTSTRARKDNYKTSKCNTKARAVNQPNLRTSLLWGAGSEHFIPRVRLDLRESEFRVVAVHGLNLLSCRRAKYLHHT